SANPLGIAGQDLTAAQRRQMGLEDGEGVGIARDEGLAARSAGLAPGDVILRSRRTPGGRAAGLARRLRDVKPGQTVMLLVRGRSGNSQYIAVTPRDSGD